MLQALRLDGSATFVGHERVTASLADRSGTFVFQDAGTLDVTGTVDGTWFVVPGSATGDLASTTLPREVEQLTRIGAHELGHRGITVNTVAPGATATETYAAGRGEELVARFATMAAFGRLGTPDEIADVVTFVASHEARWITGQVIRANGGTV